MLLRWLQLCLPRQCPRLHRLLSAASAEGSSRSKAATVTVTATATVIWAGAGVAIITDGVEAEGIITAGGIIATDSRLINLKWPPGWRPLHFRPGLPSPVGSAIGRKREPLADFPVP